MKQMRSRFRLLTLLLTCAFLLTLILCVGTSLKTAGITLDSLLSAPSAVMTARPEPSVTPDPWFGNTSPVTPDPWSGADSSVTPDPWFGAVTPTPDPESALPGNELPGTDNPPATEYNLFGL